MEMVSSKTKLSIVIPVYNVAAYVEKCVESCECQNIESQSYEIILIDDGSTDNSLEIINKLAVEYQNIIVITQENAGPSAARNAGLRLAKGKYIWFIDSDDWIENNILKEIISELNSFNLDCLWIGWKYITEDGIVIEKKDAVADCQVMNGRDFLNNVFRYSCYAWAFIFQREYLLQNNFLFMDGGLMYEDVELIPRVVYFSKRVKKVKIVGYNYRQRKQSTINSLNPRKITDMIIVLKSLYRFVDVQSPNSAYFEKLISHVTIGLIKLSANPCYKDQQNVVLECFTKNDMSRIVYVDNFVLNVLIFLFNISPYLLMMILRGIRAIFKI